MGTQADVFIVGAARTPIGAFQGALGSASAAQLGATAVRAAVQRAGVQGEQVDELYLGQVLAAGGGQAPARQAAKQAGLPDGTPTSAVSKVCGSGMMAIIAGCRALRLGDAGVVVTGGMESMTQAPYLLTKARSGYRMGHGELVDSMILDGLWDPYHNFHMGQAGELCAKEYAFSREQQDAFAEQSYARAKQAQQSGAFAAELTPVTLSGRGGEQQVLEDEEPGRVQLEKLRTLRPAFQKDGTITAANASKVNDGAAALVLASGERVAALGLKPLARIVGYASHAQAPERFTTAPIGAVRRLLQRLDLQPEAIDLWEVNEAFAVVAMAAARDLNIDAQRLNVHGGAVALGHPIGASGARVVVTLLHAMAARSAKRGLATLCIGGGEALAMVIERVEA